MGDPLIGKTIGNYQLERLLGEGGMGAVYLARHPTIGRQVAIKVLAPHIGVQPDLAERFINEARAGARIGHPNVIDIFDFGKTEEGRLYCVMEHLEGCELADVLRQRGPLPPHEVLAYLEPIGLALQAAHDKGVVHRDLKPENIFVVEGTPPTIKVLDFGIAKLLESEEGGANRTATGMVMGTPYTMAPEQAAGQPSRIGPRTDLYSLGVVLYWMLAGRPPFDKVPTVMLLAKHMTEPPPPLRDFAPQVPEAVAKVVAHCLAKEPEDRPASARELVEAFRAALGSAPLPKTQISMVSPSTATNPALAPTLAPTQSPPSETAPPAATPVARQLTTLPPPAGPAAPAKSGSTAKTAVIAVAAVVGLAVIGGAAIIVFKQQQKSGTPAVRPASSPTPVAKAPTSNPAGAPVVSPAPTSKTKPAVAERPATSPAAAETPPPQEKKPVAAPVPPPTPLPPASERPRLTSAPIMPARSSRPTVVYVTRIGPQDHLNRHGRRLSGAAAIVRQERANYHRFGRRDAEDNGDPLFHRKNNRTRLARKIRFAPGAARAVRFGNPLIKVEVYGHGSSNAFEIQRVHVSVVRP